jgi:hypothetical protein
MRPVPTFDELFAATTASAVHLEMRDTYTPEDPVHLRWMAGELVDWVAEWRDWYDLVRATVARGVRIGRARIVSEPVTAFVRHEYECTTAMNVPAGEQVRWLPRRRASDLALPGNDFWVFDGRLVLFNHFDGDGRILEGELAADPAVVQLCASAFGAVWERGIPHEQYQPKEYRPRQYQPREYRAS